MPGTISTSIVKTLYLCRKNRPCLGRSSQRRQDSQIPARSFGTGPSHAGYREGERFLFGNVLLTIWRYRAGKIYMVEEELGKAGAESGGPLGMPEGTSLNSGKVVIA